MTNLLEPELTQKQKMLLKMLRPSRAVDYDDGEDERIIALHSVETLVMQIREERERERKRVELARALG